MTGGARLVAASAAGGTRTERVLAVQDSADPSEAKVFRAHAPPQCACESLVCALELSADQQTGWRQPRGHDLRRFAQSWLKDYIGLNGARQEAVHLVLCGIGMRRPARLEPNSVLIMQDSMVHREVKVLRPKLEHNIAARLTTHQFSKLAAFPSLVRYAPVASFKELRAQHRCSSAHSQQHLVLALQLRLSCPSMCSLVTLSNP